MFIGLDTGYNKKQAKIQTYNLKHEDFERDRRAPNLTLYRPVVDEKLGTFR